MENLAGITEVPEERSVVSPFERNGDTSPHRQRRRLAARRKRKAARVEDPRRKSGKKERPNRRAQ
jgi:hypothetical protein